MALHTTSHCLLHTGWWKKFLSKYPFSLRIYTVTTVTADSNTKGPFSDRIPQKEKSNNLGPLTEMHQDIWDAIHMCVCVCVCERERERRNSTKRKVKQLGSFDGNAPRHLRRNTYVCVSSKNTTAFSSICVDMWKQYKKG